MTTTLADLIERDDVRASWFYTHTESGHDHGGNDSHDFDMYDVVFSRDNGISLYGGRMNRQHIMISGIGQSPALSRRNQSDRLVELDAVETLANLLQDADNVDNYPAFGVWVREFQDTSSFTESGKYEQALTDFEAAKKIAADLKTWLGDEYDEYLKAAAEYLSSH